MVFQKKILNKQSYTNTTLKKEKKEKETNNETNVVIVLELEGQVREPTLLSMCLRQLSTLHWPRLLDPLLIDDYISRVNI